MIRLDFKDFPNSCPTFLQFQKKHEVFVGVETSSRKPPSCCWNQANHETGDQWTCLWSCAWRSWHTPGQLGSRLWKKDKKTSNSGWRIHASILKKKSWDMYIYIYTYVYSEIFGEFTSETSITILGGRKKQISRHHRARLPSTNIYMYLVVSTHLKTLINWKSPPNRGENMFKKRHHHLGTYYKIHPPLHSPGVTVHWHPWPFCSIPTLMTKEWPLEHGKIN